MSFAVMNVTVLVVVERSKQQTEAFPVGPLLCFSHNQTWRNRIFLYDILSQWFPTYRLGPKINLQGYRIEKKIHMLHKNMFIVF